MIKHLQYLLWCLMNVETYKSPTHYTYFTNPHHAKHTADRAGTVVEMGEWILGAKFYYYRVLDWKNS